MRQINNLIRRIDLTSLQLFVAVCEEGTLTRAASRENIAMSAVSKRLAELDAARASAPPDDGDPLTERVAAIFERVLGISGATVQRWRFASAISASMRSACR